MFKRKLPMLRFETIAKIVKREAGEA